MNQQLSEWIRRGEQIFDEAAAYCESLDRQILQLQQERDARREELKAMAQVLKTRAPLTVSAQLPPSLNGFVNRT